MTLLVGGLSALSFRAIEKLRRQIGNWPLADGAAVLLELRTSSLCLQYGHGQTAQSKHVSARLQKADTLVKERRLPAFKFVAT